MDYILQFTRAQTYIWYYGAILFATFFASLSEKCAITTNGKKRVNRFFWIISFLCLFIPLAFRGYGIDHESYQNFYSQINYIGFEYRGFPEPFFTLLNYMIGHFLNNFQYVYIISAFISLIFIYVSFSKRIGKSSLTICIWMLAISFYFYMYGLVRMSIAVGIIIYAHQYIEQKKMYKYFLWCLIAGLFHYSALIMIPLYFIINYKNKKAYTTKSNIVYALRALIVTPIIFWICSKIFIGVLGNLTWFSRYTEYFVLTFDIGSLKNVAWIWPLLIIVWLFGKQIEQKVEDGQVIIRMFWILMSISMISTIFPVFRLTFFLYYIGFYLYAAVPKLQFHNREKIVILYLFNSAILVLGIFYIDHVFFNSIYIAPKIIPYYFNIP